ncbi:MAG: transcriptional regulator, TetR family [Segetibacter sp.]|jgi:AcrR family transcriptional regulator|nr:transcriptional regulator, TetR family [Segetibacter sp.]
MVKKKNTKGSAKKEIIKNSAAKLFKEKGYSAASMRELASSVGVEAASLYNHINSKSELLHTICYNVAERFISNIDEVEKQEEKAIVKLERLLRFHISEMLDHYEEVYVSDREWRQLDEPYLDEYRELRRDYRKRFSAIIQLGIDEKEFKEIDSNTAVMIFLNAMGAIDQWHRIVHKIERLALEDNFITLLLEGIKK